jgi:hypothetical protein
MDTFNQNLDKKYMLCSISGLTTVLYTKYKFILADVVNEPLIHYSTPYSKHHKCLLQEN